MKKSILLQTLLATVLLTSCGGSTSVVTSEVEPSTPPTSVVVDDDKVPTDMNERIDYAVEQLLSVNGHVNKANIEQVSTLKMLADTGTFDMTTRTVGLANRYVTTEGKGVSTIDTKWSVLDEKTGEFGKEELALIQNSYDDNYFYKIYDYEGTSEDYLEKMSYKKEYEENFLDFGFGRIEALNILTLKQFLGHKDFDCTIEGLKNELEDGEWPLTYTLTQFEPMCTLVKAKIIYKDIITIKDGKIIKATQELENAMYAAGKKGNWVITNSSFEYEHGDYKTFDGTLLNPNDFHEKEAQ